MDYSTLSLYIIGAYFLGAIPFSVLISRLMGVDLTKVGSGNFGATNVYRALGIKIAVIVFLLDAAKAYIPTYLALQFFSEPWIHIVIGLFSVVGHTFSIFVRFKGGKGIAPSLGVLFALAPPVTGIVFVIGVTLISLFRYVAPVSMLGAVLFPILLYGFGYPHEYTLIVLLLALYIVWRHRSNIGRLLQGKEHKI